MTPAMIAAVIVVLVIVLIGAYYLWQHFRDQRAVPVPGRAYGGAPSMTYLSTFGDCAQACAKAASCVGCGFYESLPAGDGKNFSCYLYAPADVKDPSFWHGPAIAPGDALSKSIVS